MKKVMNLSVDAGCIVVADFDFYKQHGGAAPGEKECGEVIDLAPGKYRIRAVINKTWNDPIDEMFIIEVGQSGLAVGDACYWFNDTATNENVWGKFLQKTQHLDDFPTKKGMTLSTGGDGRFKLVLVIESVPNESDKTGS